jgi:hypothetical protein
MSHFIPIMRPPCLFSSIVSRLRVQQFAEDCNTQEVQASVFTPLFVPLLS